jgi:hypothetical protein
VDGRREQILCAATLVLAGVLTWLDLGDSYAPARVPSPKATQADAIVLPAEVQLGVLSARPAGQREESVYAPPRELLPLDALELPDPPLPPLSVRRPAVQPSLHGTHARAYRMPASALGALALSDDSQASPPEDLGEDDGDASAGAGPGAGPGAGAGAGKGAGKGASGTAGGDEPAVPAEDRYDWVARTDGRTRIYGTILNNDPIGLASRPGEDLRFQQVSPGPRHLRGREPRSRPGTADP